ncbi:hypothetical protein QUA41_29750 [Microcoleus sp. Pol11C1]|uniref:hypothetical protein n=1 Tax=unclassified Microcoleus TaxID=2642155 RepID=UPI002FD6ED24
MPIADWLEGEVSHTIGRLLQHLTRNKSFHKNTEKYLQFFGILSVKWQVADKLGMKDVRGAAKSEEIVATGGDRSDFGRDS